MTQMVNRLTRQSALSAGTIEKLEDRATVRRQAEAETKPVAA
jgi:hypothetical protein